MAKLVRSVHVTDPQSGRRLVLAPGEEPAPHLAALVTNPAAWADGKLPNPPKTQEETGQGADGPEDAAGETPAASDADDQAAPAAKKTAARKSAATKPARGRTAADEGTSGD